MTDNDELHEWVLSYLDAVHDGNCPCCGEPFDRLHIEYDGGASFTMSVEGRSGGICMEASAVSVSPDPLLEVYYHE